MASSITVARTIATTQNWLKNAPLLGEGFRIYIATSMDSGKSYVGKTRRTVKERWDEHRSGANSGSKLYLHKAIKKYGADRFDIQEIAASSEQEMNALERLWILVLRTYDKDFGYNLSFGGDGGGHPTEEVIAKHRENSLRRGPTRTDVSTDDIIRLYQSGFNLVQVGNELGCSKFMVRQRLLKAGIPRRPVSSHRQFDQTGSKGPRFRHDISTDEIIRLRKSGLPVSRISGIVGLGDEAVKRRLQLHGVK